MIPTAARAEVLDFPAIYYRMPAALAVHRDNRTITTPAAASGKRIGVGGDTPYESYLKKDLTLYDAAPIAFVIDAADIRTYDSDAQALADLRQGDGVLLDAAITALPTILQAIKEGYPLKVIGEPLFREPLAIATDKGDGTGMPSSPPSSRPCARTARSSGCRRNGTASTSANDRAPAARRPRLPRLVRGAAAEGGFELRTLAGEREP